MLTRAAARSDRAHRAANLFGILLTRSSTLVPQPPFHEPFIMDKTALAKEINTLLAKERRSLLEHFQEATPHVTAATYRIWNEIKRLAHRDSDHAARLSALMARLHLPERTKPFSQDVGHYHYMSLEHVVTLLIEEKKQHLAAYDRALAHCGGEANVVTELETLRAENLSELLTLQSMESQLKRGQAATARPIDAATSPDLNNAANVVVAAKVLAAAKAR